MRLLAVVAVLTASWASAAPALKVKPEHNPIVGNWVRVSISEEGETWSVRPDLHWEFTADGWRFATRANGKRLESRYTAHPGKAPMTFEIRWEGGGIHGIYKVDDNTLTMAVADLGAPRPKRFVTQPGDRIAVYVLRRVKAD
jgi:uncharacterized protein (TIGR03067 family)